MRATRSLGPPVVTGTTILTGFDGYAPWAKASWLASSTARKGKRRITTSPRSVDPGPVLGQQLLQQRAVAEGLVLAIAADREIGLVRQPCQQLDDALRAGLGHLRPVALGECRPAMLVELPRGGEADQRRARSELREPQVEVVALRILGLLHPARQPAHRAQPEPFAGRARAAKPDYPDRHAPNS